ncbi:MAG: hypothetical protein ACFFD2_05855 [Promethearchaeota archaeon]
MVEQFSDFVQEALEFLSLLRASEKERFEAEKKFMTETTNILKELAASVNKNNETIEKTLEDLKKSVNNEIKKIEHKIGLDTLTQAIKSIESSVDLLQRGSTILEYKFIIQKTRELLDELRKGTSKIKSSNSPVITSTSPQKTPSNPKNHLSSTPAAKQISHDHMKRASKSNVSITPSVSKPSSSYQKHLKKPIPSKEEEEDIPTFQKYGGVSAMMGTRPTRSKTSRRAINLKKTPQSKVVDSGGEAIEIETGSDEDE